MITKVSKFLKILSYMIITVILVSVDLLPTSAAETITLNYMIQQASAEYVKECLPSFYKEHPNIRINFIITPNPEIPIKLLTSLAAGTGAPDLAMIDIAAIARFTSRDGVGLVNLAEAPYNARKLKENYVPMIEAAITKSGKLLGIPTDSGAMAMFYRRDLFAQAGVDPNSIKSWDDYIAIGKKLTRDINGDGEPDQWMITDPRVLFDTIRTYQNGAGYFDKQGNLTLTSPRTIKALEVMKAVRDAKIDANITTDAEANAALKKGAVATYLSAMWFDVFLHMYVPDTSGKWGVIPLPSNTLSALGGSFVVITEQSKYKEEAWEFVKYVYATTEGVGLLLGKILALPAYKPAWKLPRYNEPMPFYGGQNIAKVFMEVARKLPAAVHSPYDFDITDIVRPYVEEVLKGTMNPREAMQRATDEVKRKLKL